MDDMQGECDKLLHVNAETKKVRRRYQMIVQDPSRLVSVCHEPFEVVQRPGKRINPVTNQEYEVKVDPRRECILCRKRHVSTGCRKCDVFLCTYVNDGTERPDEVTCFTKWHTWEDPRKDVILHTGK